MTSPSRGLELSPAALAYAKNGWRVFPLVPREKTPRVENGFKVASHDRDVVLAWWSQWPDCNIGLATGHEFDVLDIDGPQGRESLHKFLMEHDAGFYRHKGPVALTGKGIHLYFQPTGQGNRANLVEKVDFRGLGGYVVGPPSIHPSGHRYLWSPDRGPELPLPEAPPWLFALLDRDRIKRAAAPKAIRREYTPDGIPVVRLSTSGTIATQRLNIIEVARELNLYIVQYGNTVFARCPFHKGYDVAQQPEGTPSMMLDLVKNNFYCHNCQAYGDSLDLKRRKDINGNTF